MVVFFDTLASILIFAVLYCLFIQDEIKSQRDVILILSLQTLFAVIYYHSILSSISLRVILDAWTRIWFKFRLPIRILFILLVFVGTFTNFKVYFPLLCLTRAIHILAGNRNLTLESIEKRVVGESSELILDKQNIEKGEVRADSSDNIYLDPSEQTYAVKDDTVSTGTKKSNFLSNNQPLQNCNDGDRSIPLSTSSKSISPQQSHVILSEPMKVDHSRVRSTTVFPGPSQVANDITASTASGGRIHHSKEILRSSVLPVVVRPSVQPIHSHSAFETDVTNPFPFSQTTLRLNNKRKSDFLSIEEGESSTKIVKSCTMEGRPTLKRKQSLLIRLGVVWGDEGDTIEFPEVAAKKSRIQPAPSAAPQQQQQPRVPKVEESTAPMPHHKVEQETESTSILPATSSWSSTSAFKLDAFQSSPAASSFPTPSTAPAAVASGVSSKSEPAGPFQPPSQPTGFTSPPPAAAPSMTFTDHPGTLGKGAVGMATTKIIGGRPPLSPSTPSIAPSPGNDSAAGSEVVVGIAFKSWNAAAPETTSSSSSGAANGNSKDNSVAASSFSSQQPHGGFSSNGPVAAQGFKSSGSSGNSGALNPFSSSVATAVGSFQLPATTAAAAFNPAAAAAANPFSFSFAATTANAPASGSLPPSAGFFATGAPASSTSTTSRRKGSARPKK